MIWIIKSKKLWALFCPESWAIISKKIRKPKTQHIGIDVCETSVKICASKPSARPGLKHTGLHDLDQQGVEQGRKRARAPLQNLVAIFGGLKGFQG